MGIRNSTKRSLQSISRFLKLVFDIIRNWSLDHVQNEIFKITNSILIPDNNWRMAYAFLFTETKAHTKQIEIKNLKAVFHYSDNVSEVSLNSQEWAKTTCTCCFFCKNYHCYHVLVIVFMLIYTEIPHKFRNVPILQKLKPGRKKSAIAGESLKRL
jgi:hypothetical protein